MRKCCPTPARITCLKMLNQSGLRYKSSICFNVQHILIERMTDAVSTFAKNSKQKLHRLCGQGLKCQDTICETHLVSSQILKCCVASPTVNSGFMALNCCEQHKGTNTEMKLYKYCKDPRTKSCCKACLRRLWSLCGVKTCTNTE